jgi:hypothetical protein
VLCRRILLIETLTQLVVVCGKILKALTIRVITTKANALKLFKTSNILYVGLKRKPREILVSIFDFMG